MAPAAALAAPEPGAYIGLQTRHTYDEQRLADRASFAVNVANGNLVVSFDDIELKGRGLDLSFSRTFNSRGPGSAGPRWTESPSPDTLLSGLPNDDRTWVSPSGTEYTFDRQPDGSFVAPPGANAKLETISGGARLTFNDSGTRLEFQHDTSVSLRPTRLVDRNGNQITLTPGNQSLTSITDTQGRALTFSRSAGARTIADPTGRQWLYGYDASGRLTTYTDPEGKLWSYRYDASNRIDKITDPRGNETLIGYGADDRVASVTRRVDGTSANDVTTTYQYSSTMSAPCDSSHTTRTIVTDPRGKQTTYCSDADRQVKLVRNALGQVSDSKYTPNGDRFEMTDLVGTGQPPRTTLSYATNNNLTGGQLGAGESFSQRFCGDAAEPSCAALGFATAAYAPTRFVDTEGADTLFGYDGKGNVTDVKDAATPRNKSTLTYNGDGTLATATDGRGKQTAFTYFTTPANQAGNLKQITPPVTSGPDAPLGSTHFTYDALGRLSTMTDGRGKVTSYTYDKLDRLKTVTNGPGTFTFTYDGNGNLTQRAATGSGSGTAYGTTSYAYDKLNRRTSEVFPGGGSNAYTYDKASNLATLTDPSGTVTYTYDDIDRVSAIAAPNAAGTGTDTVTYTYTDAPTAAAPVSKVLATYPGGATQLVETNASRRPTLITAKTSGGTLLSSRQYSYTQGAAKRGQIQSVTDAITNRLTSFTYKDTTALEDIGRLLKARITNATSGAQIEQWVYDYDAAGNRTRNTHTWPGGATTVTSYAYNDANQLCWRYNGSTTNGCASPPSGAAAYSYDAAGNQLTGTVPAVFDDFGRARALGGGNLVYGDHTNNELRSQSSSSFHNTMLGLSREVTPTTTAAVVRNSRTGLPVSEIRAGAKRWFIQDAIGSTTGQLDTASGGSIARSFTYDPDGSDTNVGTGPVTNLRFAGGHHVLGTNLYHFGARYYDPTSARWTQQDPLYQVASLKQANRYAYAGGDPINTTDPNGCGFDEFMTCVTIKCGPTVLSACTRLLALPIGGTGAFIACAVARCGAAALSCKKFL